MNALTSPQTIEKIERERTIPLARYHEDGCDGRYDYLCDLAAQYDLPVDEVIFVVDLLGPEEDFDGLPCTLEDGSAGVGMAGRLFG